MELKIGEIKQVNGEWYQCVEGTGCYKCDFNIDESTCIADNPHCTCRSDKKDVVFKKLEKAGDPFTIVGRLYQHYKVFDIDNVCGDVFWCVHNYKAKTLTIEIKKNKEDMEEKDINPYDKIFSEGTVSNTENLVTSNLKPFDLEAAKAGKPVCTRDGRKARIICFDRKLFYRKVSYPILALVERSDGEDDVCGYNEKGKVLIEDGAEYKDDLMMLPEKKEGWVNVYPADCMGKKRYPTKEEALSHAISDVIATVKIEWEE